MRHYVAGARGIANVRMDGIDVCYEHTSHVHVTARHATFGLSLGGAARIFKPLIEIRALPGLAGGIVLGVVRARWRCGRNAGDCKRGRQLQRKSGAMCSQALR